MLRSNGAPMKLTKPMPPTLKTTLSLDTVTTLLTARVVKSFNAVKLITFRIDTKKFWVLAGKANYAFNRKRIKI